MKGGSKEGGGGKGGSGAEGDVVLTKKAKKVTYEKQLDDINKELRSKSTGASAQGNATKKQKLRPEQEVILLEQKCILLLKLKRLREVIDDGYSILGRLGPNVVVYKCILIALVRLGKSEEDIIELLDAWKKATPKCTQMLETKRKFDGYLTALRSGMKHNDIFSGIEDALTLNADSVLTKQISSTEESKWRFRAPPPRHTSFSMCPRATSASSCLYGDECLFAHSIDELKEWKSRVDHSEKQKNHAATEDMAEDAANRAAKKRPIPFIYRSLLIPPLCIHYLLDLGKKIKEAENIQDILVDEIQAVKIKVGTPLKYQKRVDGINVLQCHWSFMVAAKMPMGTVSILHDANRELFSITTALYYNKKKESIGLIDLHPNNKMQTKLQVLNTFIEPALFLKFNAGWPETCYYKVDVSFESQDAFPEPGVYRQSLVFDFKKDPKVVKHILVEVLPKMEPIGTQLETCQPIKSPWATPAPISFEDSDLSRSNSADLGSANSNLISYSNRLTEPIQSDKSCDMSFRAVGFKTLSIVDSSSGQSVKLSGTPSSSSHDSDASKEEKLFSDDVPLSVENYRAWWHEFLDIEHSARQKAVKLIKTLVDVTLSQNYIPNADCTYRFNCTGELYGKIDMISEVSLDPKLEQLILNHCTSVLIYTSTAAVTVSFRQTTPRYLCKIVEKSKSALCIAIGKIAVNELILLPDSSRQLHVQFVLDSNVFDKLKLCVESLSDHHMELLFPSIENSKLPFLKVLSSPTLLNEEELFLNSRQQSIYNIINGTREHATELFIPPLLVTGGVSTGKSHILAHSLRGLLRLSTQAPPCRVLICTRTDAAADIYLTDYMHKWLVNDQLSVQRSKPLRVYDTDRFVDSVCGIVKHYCLFNTDGTNFRCPTKEEVLSHRTIIVTVSSCQALLRLGLDNETFSHIFLDEADQCLEVESIPAVVLAGERTRLVIAGDISVIQSQVFTPPKEVNPLSLLERLRNAYPFRHPFVINLIENYSNHEIILKFISEMFYHDQLRPASNQPCHPNYYPVGFQHISASKELQADNGGGFYNMDEIRYVVEFIDDLLRTWPTTWGKPKDKDSLIVVTPYINHIMALRVQLQLKGFQWINVDLASNLISKRYRVVIISTVLTHRFQEDNVKFNDMNHGFFSNRWMINLAISAAKSLIMVFGDLSALIRHGDCRDVWQKFAIECKTHKSLLGIISSSDGTVPTECARHDLSPVKRENPQSLDTKYSTRVGVESSFTVSSVADNHLATVSVNSNMPSNDLQQYKASSCAVLSLTNSNKTLQKTSEDGNPWNNPTATKAPSTDLFRAFSSDVKPLYSSTPSPLPEVQSDSIKEAESPERSLGINVSPVGSMSTVLNSRREASYQGLKNDSRNVSPTQLLRKTSASSKSLLDMNICSSSYDLASSKQNSSIYDEVVGNNGSFKSPHIESVRKLNDVDIQAQQMPLPVPTIPSQVLVDTKLVVGGERGKYIPSHVMKSMECNEVLGLGNSPSLSPQKFVSPIMRAPPGFPQISCETSVGSYSSPEKKASYYSSPTRSYGPNGKLTYKRNTYELPPRMLKNLHLSTQYRSPTKKPTAPKHSVPTEMNFFEELGLDSQRDTGRSASSSSSSSDHSFMEPDETICIVEDEYSSLSPQKTDWIEVKSSKKGRNQPGKKKSGAGHTARHEDVNVAQSEMCVDDKLDIMTQMGFGKTEAIRALQACDKDLQRAVDLLISKQPKTGS